LRKPNLCSVMAVIKFLARSPVLLIFEMLETRVLLAPVLHLWFEFMGVVKMMRF